MKQSCTRAFADLKQINRCKKKISDIETQLIKWSTVIGLIGNDTRLKILYLLLIENKLCVCDLSDILNMTVPAISQQLRKLKDGGLITSKREGTVIFYFLEIKHQSIIEEILNQGLNKKILEV